MDWNDIAWNEDVCRLPQPVKYLMVQIRGVPEISTDSYGFWADCVYPREIIREAEGILHAGRYAAESDPSNLAMSEAIMSIHGPEALNDYLDHYAIMCDIKTVLGGFATQIEQHGLITIGLPLNSDTERFHEVFRAMISTKERMLRFAVRAHYYRQSGREDPLPHHQMEQELHARMDALDAEISRMRIKQLGYRLSMIRSLFELPNPIDPHDEWIMMDGDSIVFNGYGTQIRLETPAAKDMAVELCADLDPMPMYDAMLGDMRRNHVAIMAEIRAALTELYAGADVFVKSWPSGSKDLLKLRAAMDKYLAVAKRLLRLRIRDSYYYQRARLVPAHGLYISRETYNISLLDAAKEYARLHARMNHKRGREDLFEQQFKLVYRELHWLVQKHHKFVSRDENWDVDDASDAATSMVASPVNSRANSPVPQPVQ